MSKICLDCGHEFVQGEWDYDYNSGSCFGECPECGWYCNVDSLEEDEDEEDDTENYIYEVETELINGEVKTDYITAESEDKMWEIYDKHFYPNPEKVASSAIIDCNIA